MNTLFVNTFMFTFVYLSHLVNTSLWLKRAWTRLHWPLTTTPTAPTTPTMELELRMDYVIAL